MRLYRAIILKLSIPCIIEINVFNLLHQTNAQYQIYVDIADIASFSLKMVHLYRNMWELWLSYPCISDKIKVNFTLEQATKAQGGVQVQLYSVLNFSARWRRVVNATPWPLYPQGRLGTHCIGGWVGPRASLDGCRKTCLHWVSIPRPSSP